MHCTNTYTTIDNTYNGHYTVVCPVIGAIAKTKWSQAVLLGLAQPPQELASLMPAILDSVYVVHCIC